MAWFASFMQVLILCLWLSLIHVYEIWLPASLCMCDNGDVIPLLGKVGSDQCPLSPPNTMGQLENFYFWYSESELKVPVSYEEHQNLYNTLNLTLFQDIVSSSFLLTINDKLMYNNSVK